MDKLLTFKNQNCLLCGKTLTGRIDKKFCDSYCRNSYNNRNKGDGEQNILKVNSIIRKNRKILMTLCPVGKATVRKEVLDAMGYNYRYFSGIYRSPARQLYFLCYDYAFSPIVQKNIEKALIVQKQDYFDHYTPKPWSVTAGVEK